MTVSEKVHELLNLNNELRLQFVEEVDYEMTEYQLFDFKLFGNRHDHIEDVIKSLPLDKMDNENLHDLLELRKKMLMNNFNKCRYGSFINMSNHLPDDMHSDLKIHG